MGSRGYLRLGNALVLDSDNREVNPLHLALFQDIDLELRARDGTSLTVNDAISLNQDGEGLGYGEDDEPRVTALYSATAASVKDRLNAMGFGLEWCEREFSAGKSERLTDDQLRDLNVGRGVLESLTFATWTAGFREILSRDLWKLDHFEPPAHLPPEIKYQLAFSLSSFGFPSYDSFAFLRAALEACTGDELLTYDFSELASDGYLLPAADVYRWARRQLGDDLLFAHPVVVLTEGPADSRILQACLRLLRPHLAEYFSFLDFEGVHAQGGAGALVASVKAFAGAGIANPVVGYFDNDTAALSALRGLRHAKLPPTVTVRRYPPVGIASTYPTLGPTGIVQMDVNGLAGSIELYLGRDVLTGDNGQLLPIQWRGFDDATGQYQGEVTSKASIHERFEKKLSVAQQNPTRVQASDWKDMGSLLDGFIYSFSESMGWRTRR